MAAQDELHQIARKLVSDFKGILASDESMPTIEKRFTKVGIQNSEEVRRNYRQLLFTTENIENYISGVILFDETIRQKTNDGKSLPSLLTEKGIIPGIKVDLGKVDLPNFPEEKFTQGLDGLSKRLEEYKTLGAKFTKWRAVTVIGQNLPTQEAINVNTMQLTLFALLSQKAGLVPIVEPEVLIDGDHDIVRCEDVSRAVLSTLFVSLQDYKLDLEGLLLKASMVLPGKESQQKSTPEEIAQLTVSVLERTVPKNVPGVVFLSGGQTPEEATINLYEINKKKGSSPWELSFSYGRALQEPVLTTWLGKQENMASAQKAFLKRAKLNQLARDGSYRPEMEKETI